jgi:hypothetical protein
MEVVHAYFFQEKRAYNSGAGGKQTSDECRKSIRVVLEKLYTSKYGWKLVGRIGQSPASRILEMSATSSGGQNLPINGPRKIPIFPEKAK